MVSFRKLTGKKILILTHVGADIDAVSSAAALQEVLKKNNSVTIGIPEHISLHSKIFAENMSIKYKINPNIFSFEVLIMVDFSSHKMLGRLWDDVKDFTGKKIIIDHHNKTKDELLKNCEVFVDPKAASCSLIIYDLLKKENFSISPRISKMIATGIVVDSAHFIAADKHAFKVFSECMHIGKFLMPELLSFFRREKDPSEKIAALKASKRARIYRIADFVIVTSEVGAFEADAARALVRTGADIAFVGSIQKKDLRISARADNFVLHKTGIDLASIMQELARDLKGDGGGHPGAAGFNVKAKSFSTAQLKLVEITLKQFRKKYPRTQFKEYT